MLMSILTGGFLAGKRTYLVGLGLIVNELVKWAVGDQSLGDMTQHLPAILEGMGLMSLRASISPVMTYLKAMAAEVDKGAA